MVFTGYLKAQHVNEFPIVLKSKKVSICIDKQDAKVVNIAAHMLASDIFKVTGKQIQVSSKKLPVLIVAGTIGSSGLVDQLILEHKVDVSKVKGQWETYSIQVLENPFKGIEKALVIVGSDRRATAYGLLEISRMIGVSPWEWWADVMPDKRKDIIISVKNKLYGSPSVKYRGIFLNDEDWGLQRWAALNFEPETGDIGPKTYAKVFELLLRLRANTIWPAMHSCTKPFYSYPKNKQVANDYAIVVGTSHCEPMLCNINAEWNSKSMGEWRYDNNSDEIKDLFKKRAKESAGFESIYTMGMRGEHDSPMIVGEDDTESQVKLLENVINDQRVILKNKSGKKANELPQVFIPYKEVLTYYKEGMHVPDDITLMWTDDNYGYIRQLSNPDEQKRTGGGGIYYHTSYWGRPHDYLWLNSTNPVLMWEEMNKAYEYQSRNLWVLNSGDIKPHEYNIELFLDMAWNMHSFDNSSGVKNHLYDWAAREFGIKQAPIITDLMNEYYRLAFKRRPEFMAWSRVEPVTKQKKTELTQVHYGDEVSSRILKYKKLVDRVEELSSQIAENRKDAFFELVYYPIIGAANLNYKWLYSYKNQFVAKQNRSSASYFGKKSIEAFQRIQKETNYYNTQLQNGKWNYIMSMSPRNLPVFSKPTVSSCIRNKKAQIGVALEGYEMEVNNIVNNSHADVLPVFNSYIKSSYFIDVFIKGEGQRNWKAIPKSNWIHISQTEGVLNTQQGNMEQRIWVSIDWDKVPVGENEKEAPLGHDYQLIPPSYKVNSSIDFVLADTTLKIGVSVFNPKLEELKHFKGFVEDKGYVSIYAENFNRRVAGNQAEWQIMDGVGYTGSVVSALPYSSKSIEDIQSVVNHSPVLEYDFYSFNFGDAEVFVQAVPTHAAYKNKGVRCAISIDDLTPVIVDFQTFGRSEKWKDNVLKNASIQSAKQVINKAGKHTLKVWMIDSGVMIDQVLIDLGGWKKSYAFPQESTLKQ